MWRKWQILAMSITRFRHEDEKFFYSAEYLFPEAARRVEILEGLKNSWQSLFPPMIARHSLPYNLGVNEISIAVDNKNTEEMLRNSRGNILRILKKKFDYDISIQLNKFQMLGELLNFDAPFNIRNSIITAEVKLHT